MLMRSIVRGGVVSLAAALLSQGCGPKKAAAPAQAGAAPTASAPAAAALPSGDAGTAKFQEFSREVEKLGSDEKADAAHLEDELQAILKIDGKNKPARYDLAMLRGRKDPDAARKVYVDIANEDPSFAPAQENLAAELVRQGQVDKAVEVYRALIAKYPKNQTSRLALARIDVQREKYDEAITLSRDVLQRQGDAIEAFRVLGESYNAVDNTPMAELILSRGLRASKDDVDLRYLDARIALDRDDLAAAVAKLKTIVRLEPKRLDVRAQLADIALQYRDFGNAAQQYEAILKDRPNLSPVQLNLGVCYKGMGRYDQAEKAYKDVLAAQKDQPQALWNLGVLYHRHLNRYDDAAVSFRRYKEVAQQGDEKAAQVDALVAEIEKLKNDQEAQHAREEHERKKKEAVEAVCAAVAGNKPADAAAVGSDPERIEVAWQLISNGQQVMQGGDVPGGEALVKCAFAVIPTTPAANKEACAPMKVMWTQILYQLGRVEEADKTIHEALKCDPTNPDAQLINQQLKEIMAQQQPQATPAPEAAPPPAAAPAPAKKRGKK